MPCLNLVDTYRLITLGSSNSMATLISAIRGPVLTYTDEPYLESSHSKLGYEPDAIIVLADGKITEVGPANTLKDKLPSDSDVKQSRNCRFIKIRKNS